MLRTLSPFSPLTRRRAYATAFSPLDLSPSLWLDASVGVYSDAGVTLAGDGDPVRQCNDQSGNARNGGQTLLASRPLLRTNVLNGHSVMRFDGGDDFFVISGGLSSALPYTCIVVAAKRLSSVVMPTLATSTNAPPYTQFDYSDGNLYTWPPLRSYSAGTGGRTAFHVSSYVAGLTADEVWINGVPLAYTLGGAGAGGIGDFDWLGRRLDDYADGDMAELLFFPTALSATDRQSVESYLNQKYSLY